MHIDRYGDGKRTFFGVHGWAGNAHTFRRLYAFMPEDCSFFAPDLPGYGRSPRLPEMNIPSVAESLADGIRGIRRRDITLIGNCGGAQLALEAAQRSGDRVHRIVLIDPFADLPWYFAIFLKGDFGRRAYYTTFANPIGRWLTNGALARKRTRENNLTEAFHRVDHKTVHEYLSLLATCRPPSRYSNIRAQIDIVYGERTFKAVRDGLAAWRAVYPHARFVELANAGHEPIKEATEGLARAIFVEAPALHHTPRPLPNSQEPAPA
jgi:pimeloyl-ACP methyl ester carboxylesterase